MLMRHDCRGLQRSDLCINIKGRPDRPTPEARWEMGCGRFCPGEKVRSDASRTFIHRLG